MKTAAMIVALVISLAAVGTAQVKTVTNSTLQKFTQKRLAAERDYRENYERMGFPSPEELDRQREEDMKARLELAEQLRQARLEKERLELEQRELDLESVRLNSEIEMVDDSGVYWNGFGGFYSGGFSRFGHGRFRNRGFRDGGYRATPFGIIPTPRAQRPQRILSTRGRHGGLFIRGRR